jgi:hypothetical protein
MCTHLYGSIVLLELELLALDNLLVLLAAATRSMLSAPAASAWSTGPSGPLPAQHNTLTHWDRSFLGSSTGVCCLAGPPDVVLALLAVGLSATAGALRLGEGCEGAVLR